MEDEQISSSEESNLLTKAEGKEPSKKVEEKTPSKPVLHHGSFAEEHPFLALVVVITAIFVFLLSSDDFKEYILQKVFPGRASVRIETRYGTVEGYLDHGEGVRVFRGIPFASPPVGQLRFKPPQPPQLFDGIFKAYEFGGRCPQLYNGVFSPGSENEDCLYLNVYTPIPKENEELKNLPVTVWIHGGGFMVQDASEFNCSQQINEGDLIYVTINYRLNIFGFASLPEEYPPLNDDGMINLAIADQQAALRWIQENIHAFGGDSGRITLGGESAGAASTFLNVLSPKSSGLFHQAILQSIAFSKTAAPLEYTQASTLSLVQSLGCDIKDKEGTRQCLMQADVRDILAKSNEIEGRFFATVGDKILPLDPKSALETGQFNRVPSLAGGTQSEWNLFVAFPTTEGEGSNITKQEFEYTVQTIAKETGSSYSKIYAAFEPNLEAHDDPLAYNLAQADLVSSYGLLGICGMWDGWKHYAKWVPLYAYEFRDLSAPFYGEPSDVLPPAHIGAYHSGELQYLFKWSLQPNELNPSQLGLSNAMRTYWVNFQKTGSPNVEGDHLPKWELFDGSKDVLGLDIDGKDGISKVNVYQEHHCDVFNL